GGAASNHARGLGLGAVACLVVEGPVCDALDERLLLFWVGGLQVRRKVARDGKRSGLTRRWGREGSLPRLVPPDAERTDVRRERRNFGPEDSLAGRPPAFRDLLRSGRGAQIPTPAGADETMRSVLDRQR